MTDSPKPGSQTASVYRLHLDYDLKAGWFAPFVDGLKQGQAVARCCSSCGRVSFPPLRTCSRCGSQDGDWQRLSGRAVLKARTQGMDGDFALVSFDGADALATVALQGLEGLEGDAPEDAAPEQGRVLVLTAAPDGLPRLILTPETRP